MRTSQIKDFLGSAFFALAAVIAGFIAWQHPTILAWLSAFHNLLLAAIYVRRRQAQRYDRIGLWLGWIAALLPSAVALPNQSPGWVTLLGLLAYCLIFWSLLTLKDSFGIAPADRGLVISGPYRFVRHPMYLGELLFRGVLVACSPQLVPALALFFALTAIQIARIYREERTIFGYRLYVGQTHWRLIPGIW